MKRLFAQIELIVSIEMSSGFEVTGVRVYRIIFNSHAELVSGQGHWLMIYCDKFGKRRSDVCRNEYNQYLKT